MCLCLQLSDALRHTEGQFSEGGVSGAGGEPDWLRVLRQRFHGRQVRMGEDLWAMEALFGLQGVKKSDIETEILLMSLKKHLYENTSINKTK